MDQLRWCPEEASEEVLVSHDSADMVIPDLSDREWTAFEAALTDK